ncbi:MAG TPA: FAD-dependent oxidoreductase [Streptosporangiaceae bacterium]|jgi:sarcosine oxidase
MSQVRDVAIVGAGLLGLAAGRALTAQGSDVVLLDQAEIGHEGAGSKGSCRIFRLGYPDPFYVAAARQAGELWRQLEAESGRAILLPAPQLSFGTGLPAVHAAMTKAGAPCELLPASEVERRFPAIWTGGPALLEPDSCVTAADQALAALADGIADIRTGIRVASLADDGRLVTLRTSRGPVTARVAIITAGPWSGGLLETLGVGLPSRPTLEQVAYLKPATAATPATPATAASQRVPIFMCHGTRTPYGLPVPGSPLYKIGIHPSGPIADPDARDQRADEYLVARLTEVARTFLPGYDPVPAATERCIYDSTPDEDFVVDRVGNVVIGCGTSGHGFKFGPLFGEWLAALATGQPGESADQRFALNRFARTASAPQRCRG